MANNNYGYNAYPRNLITGGKSGSGQDAIQRLINMNTLQNNLDSLGTGDFLSGQGLDLESFTTLFNLVNPGGNEESYSQMSPYFTPEFYEGDVSGIPGGTEKGLLTASSYMDQLNQRLSNKTSPSSMWGMQDNNKNGFGKSILSFLQRLIPGGKTGLPE